MAIAALMYVCMYDYIAASTRTGADVHQALVHVWVKASSGGGWQLQTSVSMDGIAGTVKGTDVGFTRCCQERGPVGLA